jgi:hypothetical protein
MFLALSMLLAETASSSSDASLPLLSSVVPS